LVAGWDQRSLAMSLEQGGFRPAAFQYDAQRVQTMQDELLQDLLDLGHAQQTDGEVHWVAEREVVQDALVDICSHLSKDQDVNYSSRFSYIFLAEQRSVQEKFKPLFLHWRDDEVVQRLTLRIILRMTSPPADLQQRRDDFIRCQQDIKESLIVKDFYIILVQMIVKAMDEEAERQRAGDASDEEGPSLKTAKLVLATINNLLQIPDPQPGDEGFTQQRGNLQVLLFNQLHAEQLLDVIGLFTEQLRSSAAYRKMVWVFLEVHYHILAHLSPSQLLDPKAFSRQFSHLLKTESILKRDPGSRSSRHSRFGTNLVVKHQDGTTQHITSVTMGAQLSMPAEQADTSIGGRRKLRDKTARNEKKDIRHHICFKDLQHGPNFGLVGMEHVTRGLREFVIHFIEEGNFDLVVQEVFASIAAGTTLEEFDEARLLNLLAWVLDFCQVRYNLQAKTLGATNDPTQQGQLKLHELLHHVQSAINPTAVEFVVSRVRVYRRAADPKQKVLQDVGKLTLALRCFVEQVKLVALCVHSEEAKEASEFQDIGIHLMETLLGKSPETGSCPLDEIKGLLKNVAATYSDLLKWSFASLHHLLEALDVAQKTKGDHQFVVGTKKKEIAVDNSNSIVSDLADTRVVDTVMELLSLYRTNGKEFNFMICAYIKRLLKVHTSYIAYFYQLRFLVVFFKIIRDPLVQKQHDEFGDVFKVSQWFFGKFMKQMRKNPLLPVEAMFPYAQKGVMALEKLIPEFEAILSNYSDPESQRVFDALDLSNDVVEKQANAVAGWNPKNNESMRPVPKQGTIQPWTEDEITCVRENYEKYRNVPNVFEILATMLPGNVTRSSRQVKLKLAELGIVQLKQKNANAEGGGNENDDNEADLEIEEPVNTTFEDFDFNAAAAGPEETVVTEGTKRPSDSEDSAAKRQTLEATFADPASTSFSLGADLGNFMDNDSEATMLRPVGGADAPSFLPSASAALDDDATQPPALVETEVNLEEADQTRPVSQSHGDLPSASSQNVPRTLEADLETLLEADPASQDIGTVFEGMLDAEMAIAGDLENIMDFED